MRELVLDAAVVLKWFDPAETRHAAPARALRTAYEAGRLRVLAPRLLLLEVVNVIGRRRRWPADALAQAAGELEASRIVLSEPALADVARWTARGLTAYDAAYVALAEQAGVELVTDDRALLDVAAGIARPLADATS
jgi:predicted nucleic acid-binding protein